MRVLIACEFSGIVRDAFIALGHDAVSCDLLPSERPGPHIQGDVLGRLGDGWDMMIFHAPCTRLSLSGVRWLEERNLWHDMREAAEFFKTLLNAPIEKICGENPIQHHYASDIIGTRYTQIVQPWWFGHGEIKPICLWLKNLPPLIKTDEVSGRTARIHYESPGPDRWKNRSRTLPGVANAMAAQWGAQR